tara:strand:- start:3255 stop:3683 length:429 start_codon:yes stop_codon:yes gene_type:complete
MHYASLSQLTAKYGARMLVALTDRADVGTGEIDTDVIDEALGDTDAVINGYLAKRYALPMVTVPPQIEAIAKAIAIHKLHIAEPDPKIDKDFNSAMQMLKDIAQGTVLLDVEGKAPEGTGGTGARMTDRERPFTAANMKGFI